jgi:NodT family efflux transporter outer membrane factor (OMF) lipoprotein
MVTVAVGLMLSACAVGPDFKSPQAPKAVSYGPSSLESQSLKDPSQALKVTQGIQAQWWGAFQSPELDALVQQAFKNNPSVEGALAALSQAQANVAAQQGYFFPTVQVGYSPSRAKVSTNSGGTPPLGLNGNPLPSVYNFQSAQLTVGYAPDVFGGNRRQVESLEAQQEFQRLQLEATYITLASNVVAAAIQEASTRDQIAVTKALIVDNEKLMQILRDQFKLGYVMRIDVANQEQALAQARQMLPPLEKQLEQTRDLLRVLVGHTPDQDVAQTFTMADLKLPKELPLVLPSDLVQKRPDIRSAEAQLHVASAQIGVAVAARVPQFSINGVMGGGASGFAQMFNAPGQFFSLTGNVMQTLFDGGTLKARQTAAEQAFVQAQAQYRSTVLTAFQNVADTLHAIASDARAADAASDAKEAAKVIREVTQAQEKHGYVPPQTLLVADIAYQQAQLGQIQSQAARLGDSAALFQAVGGGWN